MIGKRFLVTLGDPNGLGPELIARIDPNRVIEKFCDQLILIGPVKALENCALFYNIDYFWQDIDNIDDIFNRPKGIYCYTPDPLKNIDLTPGRVSIAGGLSAGLSLETACKFLKAGIAKGLVTCPLNKAMLKKAGFNFHGHTEFLADQFGLSENEVCMHLAGSQLRVSLVTTHPALRDVANLINESRIIRCLSLTHKLLLALDSLDRPIGVCGLNPHAGENGYIGWEEKEVIMPAIDNARRQGIPAQGPFPADTLFYRAAKQEFSAVLSMYHDQGLAPLKLLHFHEAVNITLGLPVIRTSVDHGTGYDLVGQGQSDLSSLYKAIEFASLLVDNFEFPWRTSA